MAAACALFLMPIIWAVSTSLRPVGAPLPRTMEWVPSPVAWENFRSVFDIVDVARFTLNSAIIAAFAVPLTVVVSSLAAFAIAQVSARMRIRLITLSALCLMVPLTAIWIPRFLLFKEAGLINNRAALVAPALMGTSPFYVLLFVWAFTNVPREVYEASRLDGAGAYRIWAGIALPLARPAIVAVAVLSFVHYWNSFIEPLLLMRTPDRFTVSLGLRALYSLDTTNWPIIMAGSLMMIMPVVSVFLIGQRALLRDARAISGRAR